MPKSIECFNYLAPFNREPPVIQPSDVSSSPPPAAAIPIDTRATFRASFNNLLLLRVASALLYA